jgi:hypothetical protein
MSEHTISDELRSNFHLFWDNFPFPVMLTHKDRTILDRNKAAEAAGYGVNIKCSELGPKEAHKGCRANKALSEQKAERVVGYVEMADAVLDAYWVPLAGKEDVYLHFSTDITQYAAAELIPVSHRSE